MEKRTYRVGNGVDEHIMRNTTIERGPGNIIDLMHAEEVTIEPYSDKLKLAKVTVVYPACMVDIKSGEGE